MITFLTGMQIRENALDDAWLVCVPSEGCPEIALQLSIINRERTDIINRLRSRGINVPEV
jgi:hypothetical protein